MVKQIFVISKELWEGVVHGLSKACSGIYEIAIQEETGRQLTLHC